MKIITLNIGRYSKDWDKRKIKIIDFIKKEKPDILFLQEVFDDSRYNILGDNQAKQLNKELKFKNVLYDVVEKVETEHKKPVEVPVFDGLACFTNHEILNKKLIKLKRQEDDRHFRAIQEVEIKFNDNKLTFFHTHFSNRDDWALSHLKETLEIINRNLLPVIVGDLNIKKTDDLINLCKDTYSISYEFKEYYSFSEKEETLDYVLIPKNQFKFVKLECNINDISDHKPLIVTIQKLD